MHHAPVAAVSNPGDDDGLMRISRLPAPLVRQQGGVTKDWVVLLDEDQPRPVAWRVHARFAGYLIGRLATLIDDPSALATLENRLDGEHFTTLFEPHVGTRPVRRPHARYLQNTMETHDKRDGLQLTNQRTMSARTPHTSRWRGPWLSTPNQHAGLSRGT